jgi:hypothetical protein
MTELELLPCEEEAKLLAKTLENGLDAPKPLPSEENGFAAAGAGEALKPKDEPKAGLESVEPKLKLGAGD